MYFNFRYDSNKSTILGRDILKLLADAELNSVSLTSGESLRMFAQLLIESDKCELLKMDVED